MTETNDEPERDEALGADADTGPDAGAPVDAETRAGAETVGADSETEAAVGATDSAEGDRTVDPAEHDAAAEADAVADPADPADLAAPDATADPDALAAPAERGEAARAAVATRRRRGRAAVVVGTVAVLATVAAGAALIATGAAGRGEPLTVASPTASASSAPTPAPAPSPTPTATPTAEPTATAAETPAPTPTPEADGLDLTTASSLTVLVNKRTPLDPQGYEPSDLVAMSDLGVPSMNDHSLRRPAAEAIAEMFADAEAAGLHLDMTSGYRGFELQQHLYDEHVEQLGAAGADEVSARPGRSEHQTGLAADISAPGSDPGCIIETCFADTEAGQWLAEHAWEYGFILRYPEGLQSITGFAYEPWHFRFVGVEVAADYHASGAATYEEFVGAPDAPDYG